MYLVSRFNNDKMLIIGLLLHLMIGWLWIRANEGEVYLILPSIILFLSFMVYLLRRPLWLASVPYHRYILLLCLICCTLYIHVVFQETILIPILHMIAVTVVSAFYLMPRLIWFISSCYIINYFILFCDYSRLGEDIYIVVFSVILILFIDIALHKICLICQMQMTLIRKLEREQNFERMGQQQHLATIGQIAASIAHDIRNPLTSIQGFVQLIEKKERSSNYQSYFRIIRSEITRIDNLLREVLMLSKSHTVDTNAWAIVHLDALLERLILLMEPEALKSNIQIHLQIIRAPVVRGSEDKLQQVFMNLLRNAIEAISENGRVHIILNENVHTAIVQFQDTGSGIDEVSQLHLFTPFFTTKGEGTGLGLSICQSIIRAYDGEITVKNLPDRGAEFTVTLPI